MKNLRILAVASLSTLMFLLPASAQEPAGQKVALEFVQKSGMSRNFQLLLGQVSTQTETFKSMAVAQGPEAAMRLLNSSMQIVLAKYQPGWDQVMARVWSRRLSEEEMASLLQVGRSSPFFEKLASASQSVSAEMQAELQPLLNAAAAEAVAVAFKESASQKAK